MAETPTAAKKPSATRKKTTKRGPTKAASLKALGLTQEDLDAIKQLRELRVKNDTEVYSANVTSPPGEYISNNEAAVEEEIPDALKTVEERKADHADEAGQPLFVRNLRAVEVNYRLNSQQGQGKKRTELKPRGQRGDLTRLSDEDRGDPVLENQLAYGVIEIITLKEAKEIIAKQAQNQQQAVHPAMAMLRNELGQEYAPENIKVAPEFNSQGVVVAKLNPVAGGYGELTVDRGGINREGVPAQQPQQVHRSIGGNPAIISDGFARNDTAAQADAVARRKDLQGPAAGLGGVQVSVAPTQRT